MLLSYVIIALNFQKRKPATEDVEETIIIIIIIIININENGTEPKDFKDT